MDELLGYQLMNVRLAGSSKPVVCEKKDISHIDWNIVLNRKTSLIFVLTGVSGSSENRFNLSSLLAERIPSSVSEIYCYGRDGNRDRKSVKEKMFAHNKMLIVNYTSIKTLKLSSLLFSVKCCILMAWTLRWTVVFTCMQGCSVLHSIFEVYQIRSKVFPSLQSIHKVSFLHQTAFFPSIFTQNSSLILS